MAENNSGGKSFAERYASKKTNFTSQNLQKTPPQPTQQTPDVSQGPKNLKPIDPIKRMQAELIYLVKGIDAGRNAWYYVLVDRLKTQLFLKALNDDIILWKITEKFSFPHMAMSHLLQLQTNLSRNTASINLSFSLLA